MRLLCSLFLVATLSANVRGDELSRIHYLPPAGVAKNEKIALDIAKIVLSSVYGEAQIKKQLPLTAKLINNEMWLISGTFNEATGSFGGVAEILINKRDGSILGMIHGK
jgi:hypothetical protein